MKRYTKLQCFFTSFLLCYLNLGCSAQRPKTLGLKEGAICQKGPLETANFICRSIKNCPVAVEGIKQNKKVISDICSYNGVMPIVCCPPETYSATEMCSNYSKLIYFKRKNPILISSEEDMYVTYPDCYDAITLITNGTAAEPKEFPHMALLSYSEIKDNDYWFCGGSLISKRFVLTAAHCEKFGSKDEPIFAVWARLGELDYSSNDDIARPADYKIIQRIIHPNYKAPSLYNDIALFLLERDVDFSAFVRPICLNTDTKLRPPTIIATGWGRIGTADMLSSHLLKVSINTISKTECNKHFLSMINRNTSLAQGIVDSSMLCTSDPESGKDICAGDSGGPIQIKHNTYKCMYSQIGLTSFSTQFCGTRDSSAVYTRVSNYISWIERIVWPKI